MNIVPKIYVGVDVSKDNLDVHFYPMEEAFRVKNSMKGIQTLLGKLDEYEVEQVVFESSGSYENLLLKSLDAAGYNYWQVDPKRIKSFILGEGIKFKNDKNDAKMIALFAYKNQLPYKKVILTKQKRDLRDYSRRRSYLIDLVAKEKTKLKLPSQEAFKKGIESLIKFLEKQIKDLNEKIVEIITNDKELARKREIMESIPGVGKRSSSILLAEMPELGTIEDKEAAALLGAAPYTKDSGNYRGKARVGYGRARPRKVIYMAALTASRSNPILSEFYKKLLVVGKAKKVALVAIMRKLICLINTLIRKNCFWDENVKFS